MSRWREETLGGCRLIMGDCLDVLPTLWPVDAIVTDSPYEIGFMSQAWDKRGISFDPATWRKAFEALKPGGHLLAFGSTRTCHRVACAIEDAGFEIRDTIAWVYGGGQPKSLNVSKAIDAAAGAKREVISTGPTVRRIRPGSDQNRDGSWEKLADRTYTHELTEPATEQAQHWEGWGTGLKPAFEPIIVARKPLIGTVVENVLRHATGALNIDECRVAGPASSGGAVSGASALGQGSGWNKHNNRPVGIDRSMASGRWPANLCHDGSDEVLALFPQNRPGCKSPSNVACESIYRPGQGKYQKQGPIYGDDGSAARFFYCAKASNADRAGSKHPTVKPQALMRWLVQLVTPKNGTVLDPFAGSGSTGQAALAVGRRAILIEREEQWFRDACRRLGAPSEPTAVAPAASSKPKPVYDYGPLFAALATEAAQ